MSFTFEDVQDACGPSGSLEATEALIKEHGAAAVAVWRDDEGGTVLHWAMCSGNIDVLRALIRAGVNVTVADDYGNTALHQAGTAEEVRFLAAAGASLSACSKYFITRTIYGCTPLHRICRNGRVEATKAMLELSGGIPRVLFAKMSNGKTPRDFVSRRARRREPELLPILDKAMREAELWSRRSLTLRIGLAAADVVKAVAVRAGKRWAL